MDVMANRAVLTTVKKEKKEKKDKIKKKIEKVSKPVTCAKSPPRVTKKKKTQTKAGILNSKKEVLKETLESIENGDSNMLFKKVTKPLKKVVKSTDSKENQQNIKQKKNKVSKEFSLKIEKEETKEVKETKQKVKKSKVKKTEKVTQKLVKQKLNEPEKNTLVEDSSEITSELLQLGAIKTGVETVLKLANEQTKSAESLMNEESSPIFLQLCCIKVPKTPTRQLRMLLPHTLVSPDDDVALIVKDLQRGRRRDYEPSVDHFEQLLKKHKCDRIKTIIPINQIKTEYDQYELKRNLVFSYDHFLIDGKITGHVARLLGQIFSKKRKLPTPIRMNSKDLKHEIDHALSKTSMQLNSNGDSQVVQIGTTAMKKQEIIENIQAVCKNLAKNYPGGWANIRSLMVKTQSSLAIPIYMTMKNKNIVQVPDIKPKRPKAYRTHEDELTTVNQDAIVTVTPEGKVTLKPKINANGEQIELDSEMDSSDEEKEKKPPSKKRK